MIDVWMLFTMMCPFFEILMLWMKDQIKRDIGSTQSKHVQKKVSPPPAMLINTDITHIYEIDLKSKMFNFELFCLSAPPHSKEDWKNGPSETVRHQIFSSM